MKMQGFTTVLLVDQSPQEAFKAINNVRGWWSENIEGITDRTGSEFLYHYKDVHIAKMKIVEWIDPKKVAWLVMDNYFKFTVDKNEWKNTKVVFEIARKGKQTAIRFTHQGLFPQLECYEVCLDAWSHYIHNSLKNLVATGKGQPTPKDPGQYDFENRLLEKWNWKK
jgi:hypothetical protein